MIVGKTRCYVDIYVPRERQQFRVRKTSIQMDLPREQQAGGASEKLESFVVTMVINVSARMEERKGKNSVAVCISIAEPKATGGGREKEK